MGAASEEESFQKSQELVEARIQEIQREFLDMERVEEQEKIAEKASNTFGWAHFPKKFRGPRTPNFIDDLSNFLDSN